MHELTQLTDWRKSQNLNAKEAAALLGVSRTQLFRLESGARLASPSCSKRIERITGIPRSVIRPDIFDPPKVIDQTIHAE